MVRNMGRELGMPKRSVRKARTRSMGILVLCEVIDGLERGRWREWKRALAVPRGKRTMAGRIYLLQVALVG